MISRREARAARAAERRWALIMQLRDLSPGERQAVLEQLPEYDAALKAIVKLCGLAPGTAQESLAGLVEMAELECNAEHDRAVAAETRARILAEAWVAMRKADSRTGLPLDMVKKADLAARS